MKYRPKPDFNARAFSLNALRDCLNTINVTVEAWISDDNEEARAVLDVVNSVLMDSIAFINPEVAVSTKDGVEVSDELTVMYMNGEHETLENSILEYMIMINEKIDKLSK